MCKLAIALLLPDATASGEVGAVKPGEDSSASNGENLSDGSGGGESRKGSQAVDAKMHGGEADDGTLAQRTFPLDIDQEVHRRRLPSLCSLHRCLLNCVAAGSVQNFHNVMQDRRLTYYLREEPLHNCCLEETASLGFLTSTWDSMAATCFHDYTNDMSRVHRE